jgi:hypothetical protein
LGKAEELWTWKGGRFNNWRTWELEKRFDVDGNKQEERFAGLDDVELTRKCTRGSACTLIPIRL